VRSGVKSACFYQVVRNPEVNIRPIIAAVSNQIIAAIMPFRYIGVPSVFLADSLATIEESPMQAIGADAVV
jgi:hypothetical protein